MANFKVNNIVVNQAAPDNITTNVTFTFDNAQTVTVDINHFRPTTKQEIAQSIINRGKSEWLRLQAVATAEAAIATLDGDIGVSFNFSQNG